MLAAYYISIKCDVSIKGEALESDYTKAQASLNHYKAELDRFDEHIQRCRAFLANGRNEYWQNLLPKEQVAYDGFKSTYLHWVALINPYLDDHIADAARTTTMQQKYRALLLLTAEDLRVQKDRVYSDQNCVFWIESVSLQNTELTLKVRFFTLPKAMAGLSGVHVSYNGASLGSPKSATSWDYTEKMENRRDDIGPEENLYTYTFYGENLTDSGVVKLRLNGYNDFAVEKTIEYRSRENEVSENFLKIRSLEKGGNSVSKEAVILKGKRDHGHLLLPIKVTIGHETKSLTLLLDTGASLTSIPDSVYSDGVRLHGLSTKEFATANGTVLAKVDKLSVSVGSLTKTLDVAIMPGDVGLLGVNFLDGYIYTVDIENEAVYLQKRL
jgi:predicted aspartyl protease